MPISRRNKTHDGLFKPNYLATSHPLQLLEHPQRSLGLGLAWLSPGPTEPGSVGQGIPVPDSSWVLEGKPGMAQDHHCHMAAAKRNSACQISAPDLEIARPFHEGLRERTEIS